MIIYWINAFIVPVYLVGAYIARARTLSAWAPLAGGCPGVSHADDHVLAVLVEDLNELPIGVVGAPLAGPGFEPVLQVEVIDPVVDLAQERLAVTVKLWGDVGRNAIRDGAPEGDLL